MTKYLCTGDIHIVNANTRYRIDNLSQASLGKINWLVETATKYQATLVIAGDLFDTYNIGWGVYNQVADILLKSHFTPLVVAGQHDIRNHAKTIEESPLQALETAGAIKMLQPDPVGVITGIGWGVECDATKMRSEVLVIHKCCTEGEPPPFMPGAVSAKTLLNMYPNHKYIVVGDYHVPHLTHHKDRWVLNCGTVLRKNKDQYNFKPTCYLLDTEKDKVVTMSIPIAPADKVFDKGVLEKEEEIGITLDTSTLEGLMTSSDTPLDFESVVFDVMAKSNQHHTQELLYEIFSEVRSA